MAVSTSGLKRVSAVALIIIALVALLLVVIAMRGHGSKSAIATGAGGEAFAIDRIVTAVARYDGLGHKRTGETADLAVTAWLDEHLRSLGYRTSRQPFTLPSFRVDHAVVEVDGTSLAAFPQFPVTATAQGGITAPLRRYSAASDDLRAAIALVDIPAARSNNSLAQPELETIVRGATRSGAEGVLLLIRSECGAPKMLNAPLDIEPFAVPVMLVGEDDAPRLEAAIASGEPVHMEISGAPFEAQAFNLIAEIGPVDAPLIVVSTPQSGWFTVTAERGSGMAVFLALAEWATRQSELRFLFVSNSGHERGHAGAERFLVDRAPAPADTAYWLHIGANVGAAETGGSDAGPNRSRYLMTNWTALLSAWSLFREQPGFDRPIPLELGQARGELARYHAAGYRPLAGVFGPGPYHHCINDRAEMVSLEATREAALSLAALIDRAAR